MRRSNILKLTVVVALITAIGPIIAAVYLAQRQGLAQEYERVQGYAREVVYRSDRAVMQMQAALDIVTALDSQDPCSVANIDLYKQIGLENEYLVGVGYVTGTSMLCSTLGVHNPALDLGPFNVRLPSGSGLRLNVEFPFAEGTLMTALQRGNYAAIAYGAQAVDLSVEQDGAMLASFTPGSPGLRASLGAVNPLWVDRLGSERSVLFIDEGFIVSVVRSDQVNATGAIAAVPVSSLNQRIMEFILLLVPIGLLTGILMTLLVLYLARQQMTISTAIRIALRRNEFFLVYQPIVDLRTEQWTGAEALLRWRRDDGSIVMPDTFIPVAEQSGLIVKLTERVLELAAHDMEGLMWQNPDFRLSVNFSASDLQSKESLRLVQVLSEKVGNRKGQIMVEMTERMLLIPEDASVIVDSLRENGIAVAIDDFGTGYSSLSYLENIKFDILKIDKLFVEAIDTEAATNQVVLHIIDMAKTLGLQTVAEGVETLEQARFLREKGVESAQGWLFGRPMEPGLFTEALQENRSRLSYRDRIARVS